MRVFRRVKFGCHFFPYRSLLLSTSVLNDNHYYLIVIEQKVILKHMLSLFRLLDVVRIWIANTLELTFVL